MILFDMMPKTKVDPLKRGGRNGVLQSTCDVVFLEKLHQPSPWCVLLLFLKQGFP